MNDKNINEHHIANFMKALSKFIREGAFIKRNTDTYINGCETNASAPTVAGVLSLPMTDHGLKPPDNISQTVEPRAHTSVFISI